MEIKNSTIEDIDAIFDLYDQATAYQKTVFNKNWEGFDTWYCFKLMNKSVHIESTKAVPPLAKKRNQLK